jgi:ADP-ribosylglycohydrolase
MWSFSYLLKKWSYTDAIADVLWRGGDTDTNAAIVGGLIGALDGGIDNIEKAWIEKMITFGCNEALLFDRTLVTHDRPNFLIPALYLVP